jgi:hypothetical protein
MSFHDHELVTNLIIIIIVKYEIITLIFNRNINEFRFYRVFRAQADWIVILSSAAPYETAASLADSNDARPVLLAHIFFLFLSLIINQI